MKQYYAIKAKYPDALLLFRVGDFYETFGKDAIITSKILGIVLTRRANGKASFVELAGFPHHALDTYLPKLVKAGQRVAICDQLEDPKLTKKIVKRGVTELVTPGVSYNENVLDHKENNYLAGVQYDTERSGIAFLDVTTGEFYTAEGTNDYIDKLLRSFNPSEVIIQRNKEKAFLERFGNFYTNCFDDWVFTHEFGYEKLIRHFGTNSLKGYGIEELTSGIIASGVVLHYLSETHHTDLQHLNQIQRIDEDRYVWLDRFTIRNLELLYSANDNATTLIDIIDRTITPMGSRLLKRWIVLPQKELQIINERLDLVEHFIQQTDLATKVVECLKQVGDLERLVSKISTGRITPREVIQLQKSLISITPVKEAFTQSKMPALKKIGEQLNLCKTMTDRIGHTINDDPPVLVAKGGVVREKVSAELDELRQLLHSGKDYLKKIQEREIIRTGISSLKIGYNNVFGYYLEVTHTHKSKVPEEWHRKQTLTSAERYITEELKTYEDKILGAEEKILALEQQLYNELVVSLTDYIKPIQLNASLLARVDCLYAFSILATTCHYVRPVLNNGFKIDIHEGRHPVIEQQMKPGEHYISNDITLDDQQQQIIMLTGPNMSGKSALLRQTALIVLLAQIGCYVPATKAKIGIVDKIFTRVGASDNISSGESTFMVEMNETASILNNLSSRSLILLDEIGRGTATYDGISIAWAIAEYLHDHKQYRPRVLFATHYHELNEMTKSKSRIHNYHISVKEINNQIIFLRKLTKGGSEHSFGIHVARMSGMPPETITRAKQLLKQLEQSHSHEELTENKTAIGKANEYQLSFIQLDDPLLQRIKDDILDTDIDTLTPVEALMKLHTIKELLTKGKG